MSRPPHAVQLDRQPNADRRPPDEHAQPIRPPPLWPLALALGGGGVATVGLAALALWLREPGTLALAGLAVGLLLTIALTLTVWVAQRRRADSDRLRRERADELVHEITVRRRAEGELGRTREQLELLAAAVTRTGAGIAIAELRGDTVSLSFANPAFERLVGRTVHELANQDPFQLLLGPATDPPARTALRRAIAERAPFRDELCCRRGDDSLFWAALTASPLRDDIGRAEHVILVLGDVSERRELVESLRAAKNVAESADAAKSSFLAMMSHEIRTPLHGILGMTGLLLEEPLERHQRELAETVRTCGNHLLTIVNDILDFSRITSGKLTLDIAEFDLIAVVEASLATLSEAAQGKGLELAARIDPHLPTRLVGDAGRLRQILVNLIGNAVKFTPRGSVVIRLSAQAVTRPVSRRATDSASLSPIELTIAVIDTGIGIAPQLLPRLFQPFVQGDGSTTREYGGTGLGLAICRRLAELMSGTITAASTPGQGTTFTCTVRLVPVPGSVPRPDEQLRDLVALVIDSHPHQAAMIGDALNALGLRVELCDDPAAARERLAREPLPAVVLCDASTAPPDGIIPPGDALRPRLIALTSLAGAISGQAGAAVLIAHPVRREALHQALQQIIAMH